MEYMNRIDDLPSFARTGWNLLYKAAYQRKGAMQQGIMGTMGLDGQVQQRVVIIREVDVKKREIWFFTDGRSLKVEQLRKKPEISWLFWDSKKNLQIRLQSTVSFHCDDEVARSYWEKLPVEGRKNYASILPPSSPIEEYSDGLPSNWNNEITLEDTELYFGHFMVGSCKVREMQCLLLHREGHQHAKFSWTPQKMLAQWLIP
jgi:pyridoxamine 5'-phosphate oxidase